MAHDPTPPTPPTPPDPPDAPDPPHMADSPGLPDAPDAPIASAVSAERAAYLDGLSPKQEAAILALLSEPTIQRAADKVGCGLRTIYNWFERDTRFMAAYRAARREAFAHAMTMTQRYAPLAIQALVKILSDPGCPASARVAAATSVLNFARESIELDDLSERVRALEAGSRHRGLAGAA